MNRKILAALSAALILGVPARSDDSVAKAITGYYGGPTTRDEQVKDIPRKSYASAVWVRRDGKWVERFYQETPIDGK